MVARAGLVAVSLMIFGWALPGGAQPSLVKDVNPGMVDTQVSPASLSNFTSVGSRAVFIVGRSDEAESVGELWTTDGTDAGTERLRAFADMTVNVVGSNGRIAFVLVTHLEGYLQRLSILWRTDGTDAGTYAINQTVLTFFANPVIHRGALVFSACTGEATIGCGEPWVSDGTAAGTHRLRDITPGDYGSDAREFLSVGDRLYFFATAPDGPGLWQTDLTRQGTRRVALLPPYSVPRDLKAAGERLFFIVGKENSLWTSDGTAEGTRPVPPFDRPRGRGPAALLFLGAVGESEFFTGFDPALGVQVYRTDGTAGGTRRLTSFPRVEPTDAEVTQAVALPDRLFFVGLDHQLWTSTGSRASTHPLNGCTGGCPVPAFSFSGVASGGLLFFAGKVGDDVEPWVTDGTAAGTRRLLEICANGFCGAYPIFGPVIGGRVLFAAVDDLWSTDGTAVGTRRVGEGIQVFYPDPLPVAAAGSRLVFAGFDKSGPPGYPIPRLKSSTGRLRSELVLSPSLRDGMGSNPTAFTALGADVLFFACSDPGGIWKTRGTPETTVRLTDARGLCNSGSTAQSFTVLGGVAYFAAFGADGSPGELWRTDGTPEGTRPISHVGADDKYVSALTVFQGRLFFVAEDLGGDVNTKRSTLWSSDGTAAGSAPLFDLPAIYVFYLSAFEDALYFEGEERGRFSNFLYRTDGTEAGTQELMSADVNEPPRFLRFDGQTFIVDGGNLWKTDGTSDGTRMITGAVDLAQLGDRFYFMGRSFTDPNNGQGIPALFRSDGTQAATVPVKTFSPASTFDTPKPQLTVLDGTLFFVAADAEHGGELWRTDGTTAGTVLVVDINPGPDWARISGLVAADGRLFFAADDGEHGIELWTSDGTAAGTHRLSDIAAGLYSSSPRDLTAIGGRLFFSADDQVIGREPWVLEEGKP